MLEKEVWKCMDGIEAIQCDLFSVLFDKYVTFEIFLARAPCV